MLEEDLVADSSKKAAKAAQAVSQGAAQAWEKTKETADIAFQTGGRYLREKPGFSVFSVFGFGLLLGLLIGWSVAHEERDDYSENARKFIKRWGHKLNLD
jgi:hypothetical protein